VKSLDVPGRCELVWNERLNHVLQRSTATPTSASRHLRRQDFWSLLHSASSSAIAERPRCRVG